MSTEADILRRKIMLQLNQLVEIETRKAFRNLAERKHRERVTKAIDTYGKEAVFSAILTPEEREFARALKAQNGTQKSRSRFLNLFTHRGATHSRIR